MAFGEISLARSTHCRPNFFNPFARPVSLYYEEYVYVYTYLIAWRLYMNYRCHQIILEVKRFYTNREQCELLSACFSIWRRPGCDWANTLTVDKMF